MSVYFAQVGPHIKIGYSANPERRVRRLFASTTRYDAPAGTPLDLASRRLIRSIPGGLGDERMIHRALRDFAIGNEWFLDEPEVRAFIAAVEFREDCDYGYVPRPGGAYEPPRVDDVSDEALALLDAFLSGRAPAA